MKKNIDIVRDYLNGERPFIQVGYTGEDKYIIRKNGETWTDSSGKQWIQKDSGPERVTRVLDIIREESNQKCSVCNTEIRWGSRQDAKMHAKTGKCLDCLVKEETLLRAQGKYKAYEKKKILSNELDHLKEVKKYLEESKEYLKEHKVFTFVNSNGLVEEWNNDARDDVLKNIKKDFTRCLKEINRIETELKSVENELSTTSTRT